MISVAERALGTMMKRTNWRTARKKNIRRGVIRRNGCQPQRSEQARLHVFEMRTSGCGRQHKSGGSAMIQLPQNGFKDY